MMKVLLLAVVMLSVSFAQAGTVNLQAGEEMTLSPGQTTTVTCEASSSSSGSSKAICQQGHSVCIGLNPGDLCDLRSGGQRSYCIKTDHDQVWGNHTCSCKSE